jgi:hypothetical protein
MRLTPIPMLNASPTAPSVTMPSNMPTRLSIRATPGITKAPILAFRTENSEPEIIKNPTPKIEAHP